MMILWNQNQKITTEAVQGRNEADKSLHTIRKVFEQSAEGLEIGNQLNSEIQNVNTGIKNKNELYQYLSSESENLSKQTQLVSSSSNEVINQVSKMQANINNKNDSFVGPLTEMTRVVKRLSKISEIAESRKSSMNEMNASTDEVMSSLQKLEGDANNTATMVKKTVEQINKQNNTIENISVFANTLKQRVDSLDSVLDSIKTAMSNVNEVALKNTQTSKQITDSLKGI